LKHPKFLSALLLALLISMIAAVSLATVIAQEPEPPPEDQVIPPPDQFPPSLPLPPQDKQEAYVTVLGGVGGITVPAPGAYKYPTGEWFNLTAVPYLGYRFLYWQISGEYLPGHNVPQIIYPTEVPDDYVPRVPDPKTVQWDSLTTSQNPLNVICGYGYNFQYQPVFAPTAAPTPEANTIVTLLTALGGSSVVKGPG
jgi:hypothetical protein